jgi:hypothetical protein
MAPCREEGTSRRRLALRPLPTLQAVTRTACVRPPRHRPPGRPPAPSRVVDRLWSNHARHRRHLGPRPRMPVALLRWRNVLLPVGDPPGKPSDARRSPASRGASLLPVCPFRPAGTRPRQIDGKRLQRSNPRVIPSPRWRRLRLVGGPVIPPYQTPPVNRSYMRYAPSLTLSLYRWNARFPINYGRH